MERWQSTWENTVDFNLSESGVQPIPLRELLGDEAATERFLDHPLAYSQGNGTPELRAKIAAMYRDASPGHVLVTNGSSEANRSSRGRGPGWRRGTSPRSSLGARVCRSLASTRADGRGTARSPLRLPAVPAAGWVGPRSRRD